MPGNEHKKNLNKKTIAILGVGGTGCFISKKLSAFGAKLMLIDRDVVEDRNLGRQILFDKSDLGKSKAKVASEKLGKNTKAIFQDITFKNINIISADLVIDCTDNAEVRLVLNDYCKKNRISWIHTAAAGNIGQALLITPETPCYECVFQEKQGNYCEDSDILSSTLEKLSYTVIEMTANFLLQNKSETKLIRIDSEKSRVDKFIVNGDPTCPACKGNYLYLPGKKSSVAERLCGSNRYLIDAGKKLDLAKLSNNFPEMLKKTNEAIITKDFTILSTGRVLIKAKSEVEARKKYFKIIN